MTRYHMCLSIRGALSWTKKEMKALAKGIQRDDGKPSTVEDAREWLMDQLAAGHEVYPIGNCDNFDFKSGCKGHPVKEAEEGDAEGGERAAGTV